MALQDSTALRNARANAVESFIGPSPVLKIFTGAQPANPGTANSGTELVSMTLPTDWMGAASGGVTAKAGTWSAAASGTGTAGHYRLYASDGTTCHVQDSCGQQVVIPTTAATAANGNVLTFSSTTGVAVGMYASGTGIPAGASVVAVTGTTVTLDRATTGVASGASITFAYGMTVDNASIATGQTVTVTAYTRTTGNA